MACRQRVGTTATQLVPTHQPIPKLPPWTPQRRSRARTAVALHEMAPVDPVNAWAAATPYRLPTAAEHRLQLSALYRVPPHTSVIKVLRQPVESALYQPVYLGATMSNPTNAS